MNETETKPKIQKQTLYKKNAKAFSTISNIQRFTITKISRADNPIVKLDYQLACPEGLGSMEERRQFVRVLVIGVRCSMFDTRCSTISTQLKWNVNNLKPLLKGEKTLE